jgi:hypothetical protein
MIFDPPARVSFGRWIEGFEGVLAVDGGQGFLVMKKRRLMRAA